MTDRSRPLDTTQPPGELDQLPFDAHRFRSVYRTWLTESAEALSLALRELTVTEDHEVHLIHKLPPEAGMVGELLARQFEAIIGGYCGIPAWGESGEWTPSTLKVVCLDSSGAAVLRWEFPPKWAKRYEAGELDEDDLLERAFSALGSDDGEESS